MTEGSTGGAMQGRPVVYGEVLFDQFEDGSAVLGGAPFNVAWHLRGFGLSPLFISRVGDDDLGERVRSAMAAWGMDTRGLQTDPQRPTGTVQISLQEGQPTFHILPAQAYDAIDGVAAISCVQSASPSLLYHGTLAARDAVSRDTLLSLRRVTGLPVFVDVNLRAPWWERDRVLQLMHGGRWVKLNVDELMELDESSRTVEHSRAGQALLRDRSLDLLIVTLGVDGAWFITPDASYLGEPVIVDQITDTVGAGDAFSAVTLLGLIRGWPLQTIQRRAMGFAAAICQIRGATIADKSLYQSHLQYWQQ